MEAFNDADTIALIVSQGRIPIRKLKSLPALRNCNWKKVRPLCLIEHSSLITDYKGALVELDERLYFVSRETLAALQKELDWQFPRTVAVV